MSEPATVQDQAHPTDPGKIAAELFASTDTMPCCGRVCLPGLFTRMWVRNAITAALEAQRERDAVAAEEDVACRLDHDHGPCDHDCRDAPERISAAIRAQA